MGSRTRSSMQIKWLGHATFLITSQTGVKIIIDPYTVDSHIHYGPLNEFADIVTVSHGHGDHSNAQAIKGNPQVLNSAGVKSLKGIAIKGVMAFHDAVNGTKRGKNIIYCYKVDGIDICHLGDLGHTLDKQQLDEIGHVDILIVPVGGFFTIDAKEANTVVDEIKPKIVIPMHYKTPKTDHPIVDVEEFLKGKKNVRKMNSSSVTFTNNTLPEENEIVVLQSAY